MNDSEIRQLVIKIYMNLKVQFCNEEKGLASGENCVTVFGKIVHTHVKSHCYWYGTPKNYAELYFPCAEHPDVKDQELANPG